MDFNNRQYDPQIGRFLSVDPLATSTDAFSPYVAMNNDPASLTDPDGLRVGTELHKAGIMYGPPPPLWAAEWMDAEWIGILSHLMGQRMDWNSGKSEAIWEDVMRAVADQHRQTAEDNTFEPPNFKALFASNYKSDWETITKLKSKQRKNQWGVIGSSPNDEEPVKFLNNESKVLNDVFDNISYNKGDNIFYVMGHGNTNLVLDQSNGETVKIRNAHDFDEHMSAKSSEYKDAIEKNKPFMLWLYVCTSSELAQQISQAHPNATILGANGVVEWGYKNGQPAMLGIKTWKGDFNYSGVYIGYRNGVEIFRLPEIRSIIFEKKN